VEVVKYLFEHGADIGHRTQRGGGALFWARVFEHSACVQYLERIGAPDHQDHQDQEEDQDQDQEEDQEDQDEDEDCQEEDWWVEDVVATTALAADTVDL
jgi:ankyrin repeat protein